MRRVFIVLTLFMLCITACGPNAASTQEPAEPGDQPASTSAPTDSNTETAPLGPAEEAVINQLAKNLDLQESDIVLVSSEETEFGDACLGVVMEGVMCAQVVTPGWVIVLEADGSQYEYHTSEDGSRIQPASLALVWKREGGIAGFCNVLTVFRSREVFTTDCKVQAEGRMGTLADLLTSQEKQQFSVWTTKFGEVNLDASDPKGVSDRMTVTLDFFGMGTKTPTESEEQVLFDFAQDLYQELAP